MPLDHQTETLNPMRERIATKSTPSNASITFAFCMRANRAAALGDSLHKTATTTSASSTCTTQRGIFGLGKHAT